jgi:uncharacterized protein (DUF2236 family)
MAGMEQPVERPVEPTDLDHRLKDALAAADGSEGLFGPRSVVWKVTRQSTVYLPSTVLSAFMDTAHPWIAQGVAEHSRLFSDPRKRLELTFTLLTRIVYGDVATVERTSRTLFRRHERVTGRLPETAGRFAADSGYTANEVDALRWVYLVFFYTRYRMYQLTVGALSAEEGDRYVRESHRFALCFGIPAEVLPRDLDDLLAAVERPGSCDRFARTSASTATVAFLVRLVPAPLRPLLRGFVSLAIPAPLRGVLDLPGSTPTTRAQFGAVRRSLWLAARTAPPSLRYIPPYHEALTRLGTRGRPPGATRLLSRAITGRPMVLG